jgi:hypothetical protein
MNGAKLRDEGIKQAIENEKDEWREAYAYLCEEVFRRILVGEYFTCENFRRVVSHEIGEPHHPGVWGAMFYRFVEQLRSNGQAEDAGFSAASRPSSHFRPVRRYRRIK